ncbi:MAG: hypothetical protein ACYDCN_01675 [Bacteroidia bacterium]
MNYSTQFTTYKIDTLWHPGMPHVPPPPGFPPLRTITRPSVSASSTNSNYFVGSIAIQKIIKRVTFSVGSTISNLSNQTEFIHSGAFYYSILGNSKLVLGCTGYIHTIDNYKTSYTSILPFVYIQPFKKLSFKASYLYNKGNNIIEENGYFVNNSPDLTKTRWSCMANLMLSKTISLYVVYLLEYKQENTQQFNYLYNVLVAGIKIIP